MCWQHADITQMSDASASSGPWILMQSALSPPVYSRPSLSVGTHLHQRTCFLYLCTALFFIRFLSPIFILLFDQVICFILLCAGNACSNWEMFHFCFSKGIFVLVCVFSFIKCEGKHANPLRCNKEEILALNHQFLPFKSSVAVMHPIKAARKYYIFNGQQQIRYSYFRNKFECVREKQYKCNKINTYMCILDFSFH